MFFSLSLLDPVSRPPPSTPRDSLPTLRSSLLQLQRKCSLPQEDDGSAVVALEEWLREREGNVSASGADSGDGPQDPPPPPVPGVYAIFDADSSLQHVGYARDAVRAVRAAREAVGGDRARSIRARLFAPGRGRMVGRAELSGLAAAWLAEGAAAAPAGSAPPPGNTSAEAALWAGGGGGVAAAPSSSEASSSALSSSSSDADESGGGVVVAPATAARGMTPAQAALHAERKEKLEKAMGVKKKEEELRAEAEREAALSPEERRQKLKNAVEGGDWSAVIDGQTRETLPVAPGRTAEPEPAPAAASAAAPAAASSPAAASAAPAQVNRPVTPFARASVHRAVGGGGGASPSSPPPPSSEGGDGGEQPFVLTVEAAEAALDEVRPYLIADGGNVEVVEVAAEQGAGDGAPSYVVRVRLQGACGTCGSASATMAMGIERALRATFGAAVSRVERVESSYGMAELEAAEKAAAAAGVSVSVDAIDGLLDGLRPAIAAYQGSVEVVSVSAGTNVATLKYSGPDSIGVGIVMAIKDRFPALADVKLISG